MDDGGTTISDLRCEAQAMDYGRYEQTADPVPLCDAVAKPGEDGAVEIRGYRLCGGCAEALETLGIFGAGVAARRQAERN